MQANSAGKPVYIVHGGSDPPGTRYTPILNALITNGAIVNSIPLPSICHTIDFPKRNAVLGTAFQWIDPVNCNAFMTVVPDIPCAKSTIRIVPNVIRKDRHARPKLVM